MGVYVTLHVAAFVPLAVRVGHGLALNVPDPLVENVTVPVGLVAPVVAVSVTVAVHEEPTPTTTGEVHNKAVEVGCLVATAWVIVAPGVWTSSGRIVPSASATSTHTFTAGGGTLVAAQPKAEG